MKAVIIEQFGNPDAIKVSDTSRTVAKGEKDVCINVRAIGVNPVDNYVISGQFHLLPDLPFIPGFDAAGIVDSVGPGVQNFKKGDRVYSSSGPISLGTYAEYIIAEEDYVGRLPEGLTFEQGAAIGIPYFTAYKAFMKANAQKGETVLIHGASGGVGSAAVQMAKAKGLTVIGTAGTAEGLEFVKENGADFVVNHNNKNYTDEILNFIRPKRDGVDVILEMLASKNLVKDIELSDANGRIVVIGSHGRINIEPAMLMVKEISLLGFNLIRSEKDERGRMHLAIQEGIKDGWLRPVIGNTLPLEKVGELYRKTSTSKQKATKGKTVLIP